MDDKTRGVGDRMDDLTGRADETTRNLGSTGSPSATRATSTRGTSPGTGRRSPATTRSTTSADEGLDRETDMRTRELQAEIAGTREEMSETIEAIQERLKPSNIVSNATDAVKSATTDRVRSIAGSAGDTASDVMRQTRRTASDVVEGARRNPVPALMIGAGVAWLLMDRSKNERGRNITRASGWSPYTSPSRTTARGAYNEYDTDYDRTYGHNRVAAGTAVDLRDNEAEYGDVDYRGDVGDYRTEYRGSSGMRGATSNVTSRATDIADNARTALTQKTRAAQNGLQRMLHENPLLVGAAAVLVGAAVGAALPETERENQLMGEARDTVVNQASDMARNAASTVREVAGDAVEQVTERVSGSDDRSNTNDLTGTNNPGSTNLSDTLSKTTKL